MRRIMLLMPVLALACFLGGAATTSPQPSGLHRPDPVLFSTRALAGDSLKVVMSWTQPTDGAGNADSTLYRLKLSKPWRFYTDTTLRSAGSWVRRKRTGLADSVRLALPAVGDSVDFAADSIRQCRKGVCSVPGGAAFRYVRNPNPPPAMTFLKIATDSF